MPTPERTSLDEIVQAGRDILESAGVAGLTMQAVADRVGVRAPSLYKRVRNRDDLVRLVVEATVRDLGERLTALAPEPTAAQAGVAPAAQAPEPATAQAGVATAAQAGAVTRQVAALEGEGDAGGRSRADNSAGFRRELAELARAFRAFAHERPVACQLIFAPKADPASPGLEVLVEAVAPVLRVTSNLAGEQYALEAARTFTAWAYGFISMELAGAFQLGGDIDKAYEFGIAGLADAFDRAR